eukprot:13876648-Heterocapsa_arctica.AAC.1
MGDSMIQASSASSLLGLMSLSLALSLRGDVCNTQPHERDGRQHDRVNATDLYEKLSDFKEA